MLLAIIGVLILAAIFLPQMWAKAVMQRYHNNGHLYDYSGCSLAEHLLNKLDIPEVNIELTKEGDHYDPLSKTVRLSEANYHGHTLTAIMVAAHEVGHAIQDKVEYKPFYMRGRLVQKTHKFEKYGALILTIAPVFAFLSRRPTPSLILFLAGLAVMGIPVMTHIATLPVEYDASFKRALPLMQHEGLIHQSDQKAAKKILRAAAFTYVAGSLASMLNLWKWLRFIRR